MVICGPGSRLIFSQPRVVSFFVRLLVGYFGKTQRNTQMYAFARRNTTLNHIRGCVVKILYPTLPRFQSKMAIVWDRPIPSISMSVYCFHVDILGRPSCVTDSVCQPGCEVRTCRHAAGNQRSCAAILLCT